MQVTRWVIVGAGFAGAATAWALARAGLGPGVILEQEISYGVHASGRNAALLKISESDPVVATLARRTLDVIRSLQASGDQLLSPTGGLTLAATSHAPELENIQRALGRGGQSSRLLSRDAARRQLPLLDMMEFDVALWCADEGVVDIHALLGRYLDGARDGGFRLRTSTGAEEPIVEAGKAVGVRTTTGEEIRADAVVDATGAWAGRLGRGDAPLPLTPLRRHLFVSGRLDFVRPDFPFVWLEDAAFYFRPEGDGLLLSPCDETAMAPGMPPTDPAAAELLAEKLARHAPALADLAIRRSWACLRTFAPDRRPFIGPDPTLPGLFHVSGLGGFGMTCSAAIGELAAGLLAGRAVSWIDPTAASPARPLVGVRREESF
jgi:D-arginine dehydrogenase